MNGAGDVVGLSQLSRDLALSSMQPCPEEYIKQTLIAHGFFRHPTNTGSASQLNSSDKDQAAKNDAEEEKEKPLCGISEKDKCKTTQLISLVKEGREVHKLREPRSLYPHQGQQPSFKHPPQWPVEVPCLRMKHRLVGEVPLKPEPFQIPESELVSPKVRSKKHGGSVVYSNPLGPEKYFTNYRVGPSPGLNYPAPLSETTTLQFESRFESGNLAKAVQVGKWDYELYLRYDLYTNKHTQWFYFNVSNMNQGQTYRFTIVNLYKAGSLYNEGMQPVMYSVMGAKQTGVGWKRAGHNIKYFKTNIRRADTRHEAYHYGLTWSYTFEHIGDTCYFAHCYPYTYSDLQEYVHKLSSGSRTSLFVKARVLCSSVAGNSVPLLTITSPVKSQVQSRVKRAIVLTARVHPGETNGSWMMKGFLDFITGQSPDAKVLRDNFVFKVMPMLNPDGVIVGNYRCSLTGRDLNRNYRSKMKDSYPVLLATKAMVKKLAEDREIVLYCDFHGHSKKQNVFIYGCDVMDNPRTRLKSRVFPRMLSKNAPAMFSFKDSKFSVHKSKEGTGRVVMWREMGVSNSYTMEATFCGSTMGRMTGTQFSAKDLETMGYHFCDTLLDYCDPDQSKVESILQGMRVEYRQLVLNRLAAMGREVPLGVDPLDLAADLGSDQESSDLGSDSSESDGLPVHVLAKEARKKKKKKLKTRRERNKHKALLKLTHHTTIRASESIVKEPSQHTIPSASVEASFVPGISRRGSVADVGSHSAMGEVTRNGGVPSCVQERIEERLRRRSELDLIKGPDHESVEYVEAVAMEYVRQGVCGGLVQEATQQDPRQSTTLLTRSVTDCPISITSMALYENKPPTRPSSRLGKRPSLSQLGGDDRCAVRGAFASQYVAHHLQAREGPSSNQLTEGGGEVSNTKNLANLSRLFRQLKPLHTEPGRMKLVGSLRPEESVESTVTRESKLHIPSKVQFQVGSEEPLSLPPPNHSDNSSSLSGSDRMIPLKQLSPIAHTQNQTQSTKNLISKPSTSFESSIKYLTVHDKKVLSDVRPTSHSLKGSSSPLTSSWESFSSPKELSPRKDEVLKMTEQEQFQEDLLWPAKFDQKIAQINDMSEPNATTRYNVLLKSLGIKQQKQALPVPKSMSAPNQILSPTIPPLTSSTPVTAYDYHLQTPTVSKTRKNTYSYHEHIDKAELYSNRSTHIEREYTDHIKPASLLREHKTQVAQAVERVQKRKESKRRKQQPKDLGELVRQVPEHYPTLEQIIHGEKEVPRSEESVSAQPPIAESSKYLRAQTASDNYLPVSNSSKMFSSKPASRYGIKPRSEHGVTPATVSLMLGKRDKLRPSTTYTSRRPHSLLVRYHNKGTKHS